MERTSWSLAAPRGIGLIVASGLLQAGTRVLISSRNADADANAQRRLSEFVDVQAIPANLCRHDECQRLANLVTSNSESVNIRVKNAGAMSRSLVNLRGISPASLLNKRGPFVMFAAYRQLSRLISPCWRSATGAAGERR
ncbi:SDR family NAD(P)-dependent oxidoreductase [Mycobacterium sp. 050128]|uniref:SDR family oxidoreductase n=1 Tax=Mycobacterium sp. 050128 TaxID=3096112 RepID=UPI002EDBB245